ncbi:MAG: hypothetical protein ISS15_00515 [Alphaproteobacteria bacterium]|nr:hypothetical protein [Alphaproteobacteria bacterium]MBL7096112.1 hypothetical protein [Alphaproteobacteria bacterium]
MSHNDSEDRAHLSSGGWFALVVLVGFLAASIWYAVYSWNAIGVTHMSAFGWFALVAGSLITVAVGGGLMALIFYSSRHNFDR